jgi:phosphomannomutase
MPVAVAAGAALRRAGCETIDVGFVSGPAFRFAVSHLDAAAGLLATGAGGSAATAGFDVAGPAGRPLSAGGSLERLRSAPAGRLTRRGRGRREFDVNIPYEANLKRHFPHPVATSVAIGTSSPILHRRLGRLRCDIAVSVTLALLPRDAHDRSAPGDRAVARIMNSVSESGADLGVWIDEDGSIARVLDPHRGLLSVEDVAADLIQDALNDRPGGTVVVDWTLADRLGEGVLRGRDIARSGGTAEAMAVTLADHAATIGVDSTGRLWLPGPPVSCDALVMLARILKAFANRDES